MRRSPHALRSGTLALGGALLLLGVGCSDTEVTTPGALEPVAWTVDADTVGAAIRVTPSTALLGGRTYGVIATTSMRDRSGRPIGPAEAFATWADGPASDDSGTVALWSDDPEAPGNPYPEERLVRADGTIRVPDRYALRGVADRPELQAARAALRRGADQLETLHGFSTTAPIRIAFSSPVDLASVDEDALYLFERSDGALDLEGLLASAEARGIARADVALAFSFPTQPIEDDLVSVQAVLRERAAAKGSGMTPTGVYAPGDAGFAELLPDAPASVGTVVTGVVLSPDFRDESGLWNAAWIAGEAPPPEVELPFLLTLPAGGEPPYPVVLLQHGFGGDNSIVLDLGPALAERGLASIGIDAVSHGTRGNALDLLQARPFHARDIFRQTIADQMAVLRAIEVGIDVDGDGAPELDAEHMSYLGISLGGLLGATLVAVEEILPTAVLNVAGGRVSFLGQSPGLKDLVGGELAAEVGLTLGDPDFEVYLQRTLETGQHAMDTVDGLNFARRWFLDPLHDGAVHRVLLQEGIGDELVLNENTEALAQAGGLVANVAARDPDGVSGLWRFDPPGGHGILAREDVQAQAFRFLESDGTEIIDPAE